MATSAQYELLRTRIKELESKERDLKLYDEVKTATNQLMVGMTAMMDSGLTRKEAFELILANL